MKKIASDWKIQVPAINESTGEVSTRKAVASDRFPEPFANEVAARAANNNAYPPDLTLITKAREGGSDYIYSLLVGYRDAKTFRNEKGEAVPAEVLTAALYARFRSRKDHTFAEKILSAMRAGFGGHKEPPKKPGTKA